VQVGGLQYPDDSEVLASEPHFDPGETTPRTSAADAPRTTAGTARRLAEPHAGAHLVAVTLSRFEIGRVDRESSVRGGVDERRAVDVDVREEAVAARRLDALDHRDLADGGFGSFASSPRRPLFASSPEQVSTQRRAGR
jgi:hypothetical protein